MKKFNYTKGVLFLILISTIIRVVLALTLELGQEEAYYWTFALYPELSNFDQPPMIGWFIQLFTNNLYFNGEFFLRLASIISGSASLWIVFIIGRRVKGESAGFYSALLFSSSFYLTVISGVLILPEAPQTLFYLLSLYFLIEGIIQRDQNCEESRFICRVALIMAGVFIGMAMLSKFSSILLWLGVFIYALFYNRSLFKKGELYLSFFISLLFLIPVYIWNFRNSFIGIDYLSGLTHLSQGFSLKTFLQALYIPFLLNNPINIFIILVSLNYYRIKHYITDSYISLLLSLSIPVILVSIVFSAFSESFIYAISLGVSPLIFLAGAYITTLVSERARGVLTQSLKYSVFFFLLVIILGTVHIYTGLFNTSFLLKNPDHKIGYNDITIDRFGWRRLSQEFGKIRELDIAMGKISERSYILEFDHKAAAQSDYYLARPNKTIVKGSGSVEQIRKYAWITKKLGGIKIGESAYYIESSRGNNSAVEFGEKHFERVEKASVIYIKRMNKPVVRYSIYRFINLKELPVS